MSGQIAELFSYIGRTVRIGTLVEYYNYIKAVEYLICVGFLAVFPMFYRHIIKFKPRTESRK
jgi:hypothetical protein